MSPSIGVSLVIGSKLKIVARRRSAVGNGLGLGIKKEDDKEVKDPTYFSTADRQDAAKMLNSVPAWRDVAVERISDAILNGEHIGKHRIERRVVARGKTIWSEGADVKQDGIFYVLSGECRLMRRVRIIPKKDIKDVDPQLEVKLPQPHLDCSPP